MAGARLAALPEPSAIVDRTGLAGVVAVGDADGVLLADDVGVEEALAEGLADAPSWLAPTA